LQRGRDRAFETLAQERLWLHERRTHKASGESHMLRVRNFLSDESGVTAIEYALIASLIAVAIIGVVTTVGQNISTVFGEIGTTLK
jgi:pilus assembly protein Flp/PilA